MKQANAPIKVTYSKFGLPEEVLNVERLTLVKPRRGEVAIRLLMAAIDPVDAILIKGGIVPQVSLPAIPGVEGIGEIYSVGDGVDESLVFKRVRMPPRLGAWVDSVVAKLGELIFVPSEIDPKVASMAFVNPPTAWCLLHDYVSLKPGEWVVQNAANSAVGVCVIQMAKHFGFKTINIVRDISWEGPLKEMGADVVVGESTKWYKNPKYASIAKLAVNPIGGNTILELMQALGPGGVHVSYAGLANEAIVVPVYDLMTKNQSMRGFSLFYRANNSTREAMEEIMDSVFGLMKKGIIDIAIEKIYPLADVKKAIVHAEGYHRKGKILLTSNWSPPTE